MNKQNLEIAAFILVTSCITSLPMVENSVYASEIVPPTMIQDPSVPSIVRYAGPTVPMIPSFTIPVVDTHQPNIVRYAGPQIVDPFVNSPIIMPNEPNIVRYAGPQFVDPTINIPVVAPQEPNIARYAGPQMPSGGDEATINSAALNAVKATSASAMPVPDAAIKINANSVNYNLDAKAFRVFQDGAAINIMKF